MKTFKNFISAIANDGITVTKGQVWHGIYFDPNSNVDYQLINHNSKTCVTEAITNRTWILECPVSHLNRDLERLDRVRRVFVSNQIHKVTETIEQRFKNRTGSYTLRTVEVDRDIIGVGYYGDFVITDYSIDEETQMARVQWTNVDYL